MELPRWGWISCRHICLSPHLPESRTATTATTLAGRVEVAYTPGWGSDAMILPSAVGAALTLSIHCS
jgi:hypothetical protein